MEFIPVIIAALIGSCLSFFCGFGLGTILLPAFLIFFPIDVAIAATAVVHMLNNLFKLWLVGKQADGKMVIRFGLTSIVGALIGAMLLTLVSQMPALFHYSISGHDFEVHGIHVMIGMLIIVFAFLEIHPRFQSITIGAKWLPAGGLISGFFGGLSGHQGALRSAFLMKSGMSKEAFIGTRVVIACMVDLTRISVYAIQIKTGWSMIEPWLVIAATLAAFVGAYFGNLWMKKTEHRIMNVMISISLILFGMAMIAGLTGH
ncbi:MAG: sulfite exporter TauE/SafE family protein [Flavobacteriales bacterium]|nr:sulfite exporter TauE/SafE family protein [Flavobacteriales bacterium]